MGKLLILPLRVSVTVPEVTDLEVMFPPVDITLPPYVSPPSSGGGGSAPPPPTPPPPPAPPSGVAYPPIGLTAWDRDAGQRIADHLATLLGLSRRSYEIAIVFATQAHHEDAGGDAGRSAGAANNNPLNLSDAGGTITWPNQSGRYFDRFAEFPTLDDGAYACALNYYNGQSYAAVIDAFKVNDYLRMAQAIQDSPWDEGHYGGNLVNEVRAALGI